MHGLKLRKICKPSTSAFIANFGFYFRRAVKDKVTALFLIDNQMKKK